MLNLTLAETFSMNENLNIDILIGCDFYWKFFNRNVINVNEATLAMETFLGWVLSGCVTFNYTNNNEAGNVFKITTTQIDTTLDLIKENDKSLIELLKIFWKVEILVFMLNRTLLLKISKILLNIKTASISLNFLGKLNIRTFLIISYQ